MGSLTPYKKGLFHRETKRESDDPYKGKDEWGMLGVRHVGSFQKKCGWVETYRKGEPKGRLRESNTD